MRKFDILPGVSIVVAPDASPPARGQTGPRSKREVADSGSSGNCQSRALRWRPTAVPFFRRVWPGLDRGRLGPRLGLVTLESRNRWRSARDGVDRGCATPGLFRWGRRAEYVRRRPVMVAACRADCPYSRRRSRLLERPNSSDRRHGASRRVRCWHARDPSPVLRRSPTA